MNHEPVDNFLLNKENKCILLKNKCDVKGRVLIDLHYFMKMQAFFKKSYISENVLVNAISAFEKVNKTF